MRSIKWLLLLTMLLFVLVAVLFTPHLAQATGVCPAPGTGMAGAYNMLHDPNLDGMGHSSAQGYAGMVTAVQNTACP